MHALADKDLGPVAFELERSIHDALKHLLDEDTYDLVPEEQALQDAEKHCLKSTDGPASGKKTSPICR